MIVKIYLSRIMMKNFIKLAALLCVVFLLQNFTHAQTRTATVRINDQVTHQKITGFGGFVNSPSFGYNYMSETEIRKIWGKDSEIQYNIMRLYIPTSESSWSQAIQTAKLAKSLGLIVFASPWSMPAAWKTNNSVNGIVGGNRGYLKEENYGDYAAYLNRFVTLMRDNGVELDAISIQNEPDWDVDYQGCYWTPEQITKFLREHRSSIDCKIMVPETMQLSRENYVNALIADDIIDKFDVYAGHQYGGVGTAHKRLSERGKEIWQTEYLINWNSNTSVPARDFRWSTDAFDFVKAINLCMLSDVNAWVHYAAKRYYGMLGDGTCGTQNGIITKRGYILGHYAKYVTGATRIENVWNDDSNSLEGSSYLSVTGDSVIVVVINSSRYDYSLVVDLPFYSASGICFTTMEAADMNMKETVINMGEETCRPKVAIDALSVTTLIFTKSSERLASQMIGKAVHPDKIEAQTVVGALGDGYQLSGKTVELMSGSPLISTNTTSTDSYLQLNEQFNCLVFHVENLSSSNLYTSGSTTLHYINDDGARKSHNYGDIAFNKRNDFDWILDISHSVLTDGCSGILSITSANASSRLTFQFGDVYFTMGNEKMYKFSGVYSQGDSDLLDGLDDVAYTSLDFTETTGIPADVDWSALAANKNCIYYVDNNLVNENANVISGTTCNKLELTELIYGGGDFYSLVDFTATTATYHCTLTGYQMLVLPFEATIPEGVSAYTLAVSATEVNGTPIAGGIIPANTPVLVKGSGAFRSVTFTGAGKVSSPRNQKVNNLNGVYIAMKVPFGSYYLKTVDNSTAFHRATSGMDETIHSFGAYLTSGQAIAETLSLRIDGQSSIGQIKDMSTVLSEEYYTPMGQRVFPEKNNLKGIYIVKSLMSDGSISSRKIHIR